VAYLRAALLEQENDTEIPSLFGLFGPVALSLAGLNLELICACDIFAGVPIFDTS